MKKLLFLTGSYFQFIVATNLRQKMFQDSVCDIILFDNSVDMDKLKNTLSSGSLFKNCYLASTSLLNYRRSSSFLQLVKKRLCYLHSLINPRKAAEQIFGSGMSWDYDVVLINFPNALCDCIFNACRMNNPSVECWRFEEGGFSNLIEYPCQKSRTKKSVEDMFRKCFHTFDITNYIKKYYFFYPDFVLFKAEYPILQMPLLTRADRSLADTLNRAFDYANTMKDVYDKKFIFFESGITHADGGNEDVAYIRKLTELVGIENVMVRLHPRSTTNRFSELGVKTNMTRGIPWEVIEMNYEPNGQVFITDDSASVLAPMLYFNDDVSVIMLYKAYKKERRMQAFGFDAYIQRIKEKCHQHCLITPNNMVEFENAVLALNNQ